MATVDATRMAEKRATARDLKILPVADAKRRKACEADDCEWLRTYCPDVFYNPFARHQMRIIEDCGNALRYGIKKCTAAPRGDGKSSIVKYLALKHSLSRQLRFPLIVAATSSKAKKTLGALKRRLSAKSSSILSDDYPLECAVARYVDPWPSRARNVTANGRRTIHVEWGADSFIVPSWEDEEPLGPILLALGVTSDDLQGCNIYDQRPDFVMLDDLDSRDSLASEDGLVAGKIEEIVDKTIPGLGGQNRPLGVYMLCTITSRKSAAYKYSDPKKKPAWSGERIAAILKWPARSDLWEQYVELRQWGQQTFDESGRPVDVFGRKAHQFYLDNRIAMDEGAELSNPHNYEAEELPDGTQKQVSSLQRCYDYIADEELPSFLTEHQNDPPETDGVTTSGLTRELIKTRLSGLNRGELPPQCTLVVGIDAGKLACHWVAGAFRPGCVGSIVQYGIIEVTGAEDTQQQDVIERAILRSLLSWKDEIEAHPFRDADGNPVAIAKVLIDSGYCPDAIYEMCHRYGDPYRATKGLAPFRHRANGGNHWFRDIVKFQNNTKRLQLYFLDANHWKRSVHDRFLSDPLDSDGRPRQGSLTLFVPAGRRDHNTFTAHVVAEEWTTQFVPGKGDVSKFVVHSNNNHFLDAAALMLAGAEMSGIGVFTTAPTPRRTLAEMAKAARK